MGEAAEEGGGGGDEGMAALLKWAAHMGMSDSPWPPPTPSISSPVEPSSSCSSYCLGRTLFVSCFSEAGGRGLAAARDLVKGELILRVPRKALFTTDSAMADEKFASCVKRHQHRLSPTQMLIVCLLAEVEKGRCSRWYPYLVQLPRSYNTLANFTRFEVQALQVEDAIWVSEKAVVIAKSEWKEAVGLMQDLDLKPQLLTFRSWLWASATISSRTLHIPWDSAGCLCPVGDLFNYAAPDEDDSPEMSDSKPETTSLSIQLLEHSSQEGTVHNAAQPDGFLQRLTDGGYDENMNSYCFYARKRYKKGEQVLLGYGTYTNLELLEHYGFVLKENPNDKAFIELKAEVCTSSSWPRDSLYIQHDGVPSFALLCALRLWATPMNLRRTVGNRIYSGSMVSVENEVLIMKWLAKHCTDILARLKTTIGEDGMLWSTIDKMIDHPSCLSSTVVLPRTSELREFFEAHGLTVEAGDYNGMPVKAGRSLERWKYAIQWRLAYKKMLQGCVFYCENLICCLSPQHF
ncbi:hypothetical protein OPV22_001698 [Ensete ventricosum]|uniref:SET domain-containing protein n=1 Tax=Ensete ventricosum TaxID=4639 RepID=A0AAV8RLU0_ENSVE|nr:hypothetical protein OPV22_001698 [Ensete ventricosum]